MPDYLDTKWDNLKSNHQINNPKINWGKNIQVLKR
jgi:hypothetical protein